MVPCGRPGRGTAANGLVLGDHAPGVRYQVGAALVFTVLVPGTATVVIPRYLLGARAQPVVPFGLIGILPITLGVACYLRCAWDFASTGRGTPAPIDPPKELVVGGLYAS